MKSIKIYTLLLLLMIGGEAAFAQTGILIGTVKDSTGTAIEMASVMIKETGSSIITDNEGAYTIKNIQAGNYTVVVNMVGYKVASNPVTIKANETTTLNIVLLGKVNELNEVVISGLYPISGMAHMNDVYDGVIYAGKKNEVLILDSLNANTAQNNPRQVLGRVPGAYFSETEGSGFPSNGIGFRGLNPTQSVEVDTREDGYNIAGDIYGYPESYFLPPLEATERVDVTRGASSLQFGPQFGGVIDYVIKSGPANKPLEFTTEQTGGSYGLFNSFSSIGGTYKKWSYYGFVQYEGATGWRPNSQIQQVEGFGRIGYKVSNKFKIGLEYSLLRNILHMPGGLSDAEFNQNPDQSFRSRNWLTTPWNILALTSEYKVTDKTLLTLKSVLNVSQRNIVWRNEDGGPEAIDSIVNNSYAPREVEHEAFGSSTTEVRLLSNYYIGSAKQVLAAGVRVFDGWMKRQGGGPGSTSSDFDLNLYGGTYGYDLDFITINVALFVENTFHIGKHLSIIPGFRFEYIKSMAKGYVTTDDDSVMNVNESKSRYIPLAGLGLQFKTTYATNIYANISQAYRPIEYSFQYPLGLDVNARIDPNLKDISGYNADLGWRGSIKNFLNFDVGGFYMTHNNDIAIETLTDAGGNSYTYETNVANAVHEGIETYVELSITKLLTDKSKIGDISFFNSFAYDHATYVNGLYKGNYVEYAPLTTERVGITYSFKGFSTTFLYSTTSKSFSDANNTVADPDAEVGIIPAYHIMDWSFALKIRNFKIKAGVNNLADAKYFTLRTNEYPGPGIIPSIGRTFYVGLNATF